MSDQDHPRSDENNNFGPLRIGPNSQLNQAIHQSLRRLDGFGSSANGDEHNVFNRQIANIVWKRRREGTNQDEYLIKFRDRSYLHVQWRTQKQLVKIAKSPQTMISQFNWTHSKRLSEGKYDQTTIEEDQYFDPSYCQIDKILTTTELFPVIHSRKAKEIKGK